MNSVAEARGGTRMINPKDYVRDLNFNPIKGMKKMVMINLDDYPVEVVKNGKHYSLDEYLALKIEALLDIRMKEDRG